MIKTWDPMKRLHTYSERELFEGLECRSVWIMQGLNFPGRCKRPAQPRQVKIWEWEKEQIKEELRSRKGSK